MWVPDAVLGQRPNNDADVDYQVRDVNATDMSTRVAWRSAELVPAELAQKWLDQLWFEELRTTKPVVKNPAKLLQQTTVALPPPIVPQHARVRDRHTPGLANAPAQRVVRAKHTKSAGTSTPPPAPPPSQSSSTRPRRSSGGRYYGLARRRAEARP